jgi:LPS-assembly protein
MVRRSSLLAALSLLSLAVTARAADEDGAPLPDLPAPVPDQSPGERMVEFEADAIAYDENSDVVTASGNVRVRREDQTLTADTVVYDRRSGKVTASGNVLGVSANGDKLVASSVELNETLRDGVIENVLLVLADNSRLAANRAVRVADVSTLDHAVYSPCAVIDADTGCPRKPLWSIKAVKVVHDPGRKRVYYSNARLELLGTPILALPKFSHPESFDESQSGILSPDVSYSRELGAELAIPYLWAIAPEQDLTVTGHFYTGVNPVLGLEYRRLFAGGPLRVATRLTQGPGEDIDLATGKITSTPSRFRGYFEANGQFDHGAAMGGGWRSTFSSRLTTDDNFPGRYQISLDTTLRTTYALERFRDDSYVSVSGWFFQGLRPIDQSSRTPLALPLVDVRWRPVDSLAGGRLMVAANSLGLYRQEGQTMARAVSYAQWDRSFLTGLGQRLTLTGLLRGDLYSVDNATLADDPRYAGTDGFHGRIIPLVAADLQWPFAGALGRGLQVITPRVQLVGSWPSANNSIPNEDSRAIDLEESNLFALNRFSGYDRFEDGARVTYGLDWLWTLPTLTVNGQIGQSYRLDNSENLFPSGTGLDERLSDIVARLSLRYKGWLQVTERLRLDRDSFAVRRNETDVSIGNRRTFVTLGYLKFNRNIQMEDLVDHEELRAGARLAFARYWAVFGSTVIDLTSAAESRDPLSDGYQPIRHRFGIAYADECFNFSITWRRNYVDNPNARKGNTFLFSIALRNLG